MISNPPLQIQVTRGDSVESTHLVEAIVMDPQGTRMESFGELHRPVFARSAIKLIQALQLVESEAYEKFSLSPQELALACASHNGEKQHTELAELWLQKLGLSDGALACGAHWPGDRETELALIRQGVQPRKVHNNCSGKHCGILSVIRQYQESADHYQNWDHPAQVRLRKLLSDTTRVDFSLAPWAVDGCGIPTYAVPLKDICFAMTGFLGGRWIPPQRWTAMGEVLNAVRTYPQLVGGSTSVDSRVLAASDGNIVIKTGAEGVYTGLSFGNGVGIAIKSLDGSTRGARAALAFLLRRYHCAKPELMQSLQEILVHPITNWAGAKVGDIRVLAPDS